MTDGVGIAGDAGAAPAVALPTIAEAAASQLNDLKWDREFAGRYLGGSADAKNTMRTLLTLAHGTGLDDATAATLADSVKLVRLPSAAVAERQQRKAQAKTEAAALKVPWDVAAKFPPAEVAAATQNMSGWVASLELPSSIQRTVLDRISSEGPKLDAMSDGERATWLGEQERMLIAAAGSQEKAAAWFAGARQVLKDSKHANSYISRDAFIIRNLALVADARKAAK
jgi:hypothetical protein